MKPILRHQSHLLCCKSDKPHRVIQIRPALRLNLVLRPTRASPQRRLT